MASDTHWWKRAKNDKKCECCGRVRSVMEYKGKGTAKCGFNRLCDKCYDERVKHVYKVYVKRVKIIPCVFIFILGIFIGGAIVYTSVQHLNNFVYITIVTERQKQILVEWALEKAENVSPQVIRDMVDTACESKFPYLVMAIIGAETIPKFDPGSVSSAGCIGPMQVNPKVWINKDKPDENLIVQGIIKEEKDLFDPVLGVRAGIYIFTKELVKAKGNLREATWSYVGLKYNKKDAVKYFECIQNYLGQIYLAVHMADKGGEGNGKEKETEYRK